MVRGIVLWGERGFGPGPLGPLEACYALYTSRFVRDATFIDLYRDTQCDATRVKQTRNIVYTSPVLEPYSYFFQRSSRVAVAILISHRAHTEQMLLQQTHVFCLGTCFPIVCVNKQ